MNLSRWELNVNLAKIAALAAVCLVSQATHASTQCGLNWPDGAKEFFRMNEKCEISFDHDVIYANLNYLTIYDKSGFREILEDSTFFANFDGKNYFVSEEVDDPRVTIKVLGQEEAQPIQTSGVRGYQGKSTIFVQVLPAAGQKKSRLFSGRLSCLTVAEGDDHKSFKGRFCAPDNSAGRSRLIRFKSVLSKVEFE
jgi:hypothetical protein